METQDRLIMREQLELSQEKERLSCIKNEYDKKGRQIDQLQKQIISLKIERTELDSQWREGILSIKATQCPPVLEPVKSRKKDPRKRGIDKALKKASPEKLAKIAALMEKMGIEL